MSTTGVTKRNAVKAVGGIGLALAACAACCAPLLAPWIVAIIAASGAGLCARWTDRAGARHLRRCCLLCLAQFPSPCCEAGD